MPLSEARKKANAKWAAENMATLGCKMKKDRATRVKRVCAEQGITVNTMLNAAIDEFLAKYDPDPED